MKTIFSILDKISPILIFLGFSLLSLFLSLAAFIAGNLVFFEPFYFIPLIFTSWYGSKRSGLGMSVFTVVLLIITVLKINHFNLPLDFLFYYGLSHLTAYVLLAILITNFRKVHRFEVSEANTDELTGLLNTRSFYNKLTEQLLGSIRYKRIFSLAYIDIDNFKDINDSLGHPVGDRLLVEVAECLTSSLRKTDSIARLGGDEFACLLPETGKENVKLVFSKVKDSLEKKMRKNKWNVTFSIGIVTFKKVPENIKSAMKITDDLMYSVKNNQKNNVAYKVWPDSGKSGI